MVGKIIFDFFKEWKYKMLLGKVEEKVCFWLFNLTLNFNINDCLYVIKVIGWRRHWRHWRHDDEFHFNIAENFLCPEKKNTVNFYVIKMSWEELRHDRIQFWNSFIYTSQIIFCFIKQIYCIFSLNLKSNHVRILFTDHDVFLETIWVWEKVQFFCRWMWERFLFLCCLLIVCNKKKGQTNPCLNCFFQFLLRLQSLVTFHFVIWCFFYIFCEGEKKLMSTKIAYKLSNFILFLIFSLPCVLWRRRKWMGNFFGSNKKAP